MLRRKTTTEFKQEVYDLVGNEYTVLGEYKNERTPIALRHNVCNYEWDTTTPHDFLRKGMKHSRCPQCSHHIRYNHDSFIKAVNRVFGADRYKVLSHFTTVAVMIHVQCLVCNHKFWIRGYSLLSGHGCNKCARKAVADKERKNKEQFQKELDNKYPGQFKVLGDYKDRSTPIEVLHITCNHTITKQPRKLLHSPYCKYCNMSSGEFMVNAYLIKLGVNYEYGYILPNKLHLDFWLPEQKIAIEYDGRQHYEEIDLFDKDESLEVRKERDRRKNEYCKKKGIKLIRVPYTYNTYEKVKLYLDDQVKSLG